jgi:hypothetical protein
LLKFTREGYNTPFNALLGITKLAMTILGDNPSLPRIVWESETFDELTIDGKTVSLDGLRRLVQFCLERCERSLTTVLCGMQIAEAVVNRPVFDNHWNTNAGYSFITDPRNGFHHAKKALVQHIMSSSVQRNRYCSHCAPRLMNTYATLILNDLYVSDRFFKEGTWDKKHVEGWLKSTATFSNWLIVAMHLTYGQPARGTELCSLLYSNSSHGQRHLFWARGTMMLVTQYDKSRSLTQRNKLIARFFASQVARLMKLYLLYVRPMEWYEQRC